MMQAPPVFEQEGAESGLQGLLWRTAPVRWTELDGVIDFVGGEDEGVRRRRVGGIRTALGEMMETAQMSRHSGRRASLERRWRFHRGLCRRK